MPKLIRLTTEGSSGFFKNSFNEDIVIKPKSKIALLNTAMSFSDKTIAIDDSNDEFQYNIAGKGPVTVNLAHGEYEPKPFLDMVTDSMNTALLYDGPMIGSVWKAVRDQDLKLALQLNRSKIGIPDIPAQNMIGVTKAIVSGTIEKWSSVVATGFQAFVFSNDIFIESCGVLQVDINTRNECYLGLTTQPMDGISTINLDYFKYAIGITNSGGNLNYAWVIDGNETDSGILAVNGRTMQVRLYNDVIHFVVMDGNAVEHTLATTPYAKADYKCLMSLYNNNTVLQRLRWINNPFIKQTANGYTYYEYDESISEANKYRNYEGVLEEFGAGPPSALLPVTISLNFPKVEVQRLFGFSDPTYQVVMVTYTFTADSNFDVATAPSSVIIELPYIQIDSWDGKDTQRRKRNILAIIPNFLESNEKLIYEPANLTWVEVNNIAPISLREIAVRVTSWNDDVVQFSSGCTISLLIDG